MIFDVQRVRPVDGPSDAHRRSRTSCRPPSSRTATPSTRCCCPASVTECYTMAMDAFDLAERLQTPVFVMSDLDLGMNNWMSQPFDYPTKPLDRGKRLDAETLKRLGEFGRYRDVDGDGIPYRTVPGDGMPAVLHARLGPQREGAVQRARRRLRQQPRPAGAQVRDGADAGAEARGRDGRQGDDRPHRLRHDALGDRRVARPAEERGGARDVVPAAARPTRSRRRSATSSTAATASTSSSRTATARCCRCSRWSARRRSSPSCAASATTSGCRSTAAR